MTNSNLIMELTMEQGPTRITQVQPPVGVWAQYFGVDFDDLPTLTITNLSQPDGAVQSRPVVEHDHNWTIETESADVLRPAIIRFMRTGTDTYSYWIYQLGEPEYEHCRWVLDTFPNPNWTRGRRWLIV
jgi:hypothetical protein